jgi:diguanylate cyclase (GGDEF)-like protein/PAS domain S-box-containing protein
MKNKLKEHYLKSELYELVKSDSTLFNFIQENSLDGLWYWNLEKLEDEWLSPKFWEVLGYDPQKKKHSPTEWQDIIFKDDLDIANINFSKHLQDSNYPYDQIVRYKHKDGSTVWIRCRGTAIRDENGKAIRMLGAHTNVTELQNQIIELEQLKNMTHHLLSKLGEELDYQRISDNLICLTKAKFVAFNLYNQEGTQFTTKSYSGNKDGIEKAMDIMGIKLDQRIWNHDSTRQEKIKDKTVTRFPTLHDLVGDVIPKSLCTLISKTFNIGEVILVKIMTDNVMLGDFTLLMHNEDFFDKDSILEIYANEIGIALVNSWSSKKLMESVQRYKMTLQGLDNGVVIHGQDSSIIDFNTRALEILGLSQDQLLGKVANDPIWKFVDINEKPLPLEKYPVNCILANQKPINDYTIGIVSSAGREITWVQVKGTPIFDYEGKMMEVVVSFFDITQLKNANNKLIKSEKRYRLLYETMNQGVIYQNKDGCIISCNPKAEEILGLSLSQMQAKNPTEPIWKLVDKDGILIPGGQSPVMLALKNKKITGPMICGVFIPEIETYKWLNLTAIPLFIEGDENPYQVYATFEDITQLKLIENERLAKQKEIEESELKFRLLTTEMPLGLAEHEIICDEKGHPIDFRFITVNDTWESVMGVNKDVVLGKRVMDIFPNTEKHWIETYGKVAIEGKPIKFESYARELNKHLSSSVYSPKKGYFAVVVEDITSKKELEFKEKYLRHYDPLTDLINRQHFDEHLKLLESENHLPLTLVNFDINGLVIINEAFGRQFGDEYIKFVAKTLKEIFDNDSIISRVGGNQFAIILNNTRKEDAESKSRKVANLVREYSIKGVSLSVAYGIATKTDTDIDVDKLFMLSENAMYSNKIFESKSYRNNSIKSIIRAYDEKNPREQEHSYRVSELCEKFGIALGMNHEDINKLKAISHLHDIGKIAINEEILNKPGKLNENEWEIIKKHPEIGARIISTSDEYSVIADDILSHHERFDGKGYPRGLSGQDIPLRARIIAIIDSYDAMISIRPYRKAMTKEEAIEEIKQCSGTQFDPYLVDIFINQVIENNADIEASIADK